MDENWFGRCDADLRVPGGVGAVQRRAHLRRLRADGQHVPRRAPRPAAGAPVLAHRRPVAQPRVPFVSSR